MDSSYYRDIKHTLIANGCSFVWHGKSDHEIWYSPISKAHFTVDAGTKTRFTAHASLKQAGIKPTL